MGAACPPLSLPAFSSSDRGRCWRPVLAAPQVRPSGAHPTPARPCRAGSGSGSLRRHVGARSPPPLHCRRNAGKGAGLPAGEIFPPMTPEPATAAGFGKGFALLHSVSALRVPTALAPWRRGGVGTGNVASRLRRDVLAPCRGGVEQGTTTRKFVYVRAKSTPVRKMS